MIFDQNCKTRNKLMSIIPTEENLPEEAKEIMLRLGNNPKEMIRKFCKKLGIKHHKNQSKDILLAHVGKELITEKGQRN